MSKDIQTSSSFHYASPFHLEENWCIRTENRNHNCTHAEIDTLISKEIINTIDLEIMTLLCKWRFVNTHNITIALNHSLPGPYKKTDYSRNLRKLVRAGIIIRHYLSSTDNCEATIPITPLRFYSLSPGARSYVSQHLDLSSRQSPLLSDIQIMESLAVSQLMITLSSSESTNIKSCHTAVTRQTKQGALLLPAQFCFRMQPDVPSLKVYVFCGRSNPGSLNKLVLDTCTLLQLLDPAESFIIIVLLETTNDIAFVHQRTITKSRATNFSRLYYTTDHAIFTDSLFNSLYQCDESDGVLSINRVELSTTNKILI